MKQLFNTAFFLFFFTVYTLLNTMPSNAEAWPNLPGEFKNTLGSFQTFPEPSYIDTVLVDSTTFLDADLVIKNQTRRFSVTSEFTYGLDAETTLLSKLDLGHISEKFTNIINRNGSEQIAEIDLDYFVLDPTISFVRQIKRTDFDVYSVQLKYYPGSFVFSNNGDHFNQKLVAYEFELLWGNAFEANLGNIAKVFGDTAKKRWHYQEWKAGVKQLPKLTQTEWKIQGELGLRPADKFLAVFGFEAKWNGGNFIKRPFNEAQLNNFIGKSILNAEQQADLRDFYNSYANERSRFTDYQISYKLTYEVGKNRELSIQGFSNVIKGKPFKNNIAVLNYELKF